MAFLRPASPNRMRRSRQDSLILLTNLSASAFRFGDRAGTLTCRARNSFQVVLRFRSGAGSIPCRSRMAGMVLRARVLHMRHPESADSPNPDSLPPCEPPELPALGACAVAPVRDARCHHILRNE